MAYEQKDNSGSLFKNDRREKDSHPHTKGSALIDGVEYWISGWTNEARDGSKYQSLKFERKDKGRSRSSGDRAPDDSRGAPQGYEDDLDSDIPFIRSDGVW